MNIGKSLSSGLLAFLVCSTLGPPSFANSEYEAFLSGCKKDYSTQICGCMYTKAESLFSPKEFALWKAITSNNEAQARRLINNFSNAKYDELTAHAQGIGALCAMR